MIRTASLRVQSFRSSGSRSSICTLRRSAIMVRSPYVLPADDDDGGHRSRPMIDEAAALPPLRAAGPHRDANQRVLLLIPMIVTGMAPSPTPFTGSPATPRTSYRQSDIGNPARPDRSGYWICTA
jgi:hypothetical protein